MIHLNEVREGEGERKRERERERERESELKNSFLFGFLLTKSPKSLNWSNSQ